MSIARPTALIRRAVALPIGLLDRIEASLDALWMLDSSGSMRRGPPNQRSG
jgi:hypothetical protein